MGTKRQFVRLMRFSTLALGLGLSFCTMAAFGEETETQGEDPPSGVSKADVDKSGAVMNSAMDKAMGIAQGDPLAKVDAALDNVASIMDKVDAIVDKSVLLGAKFTGVANRSGQSHFVRIMNGTRYRLLISNLNQMCLHSRSFAAAASEAQRTGTEPKCTNMTGRNDPPVMLYPFGAPYNYDGSHNDTGKFTQLVARFCEDTSAKCNMKRSGVPPYIFLKFTAMREDPKTGVFTRTDNTCVLRINFHPNSISTTPGAKASFCSGMGMRFNAETGVVLLTKKPILHITDGEGKVTEQKDNFDEFEPD